MIHFDTKTFDQALSGDKPMMVDFWATWCGPCRMLGPVIEDLARKYEGKVVVGKVDIDEQPDLAVRYGVATIPTVIFFENGKEIDRKVGVMPPEVYTRILDR